MWKSGRRYSTHPRATIGPETKFQFPACRCITSRPLFHSNLAVPLQHCSLGGFRVTERSQPENCDLLACRFESSCLVNHWYFSQSVNTLVGELLLSRSLSRLSIDPYSKAFYSMLCHLLLLLIIWHKVELFDWRRIAISIWCLILIAYTVVHYLACHFGSRMT